MNNKDSFYSIDRLVEFGLGTAIATQMTTSMNEVFKNMSVPGAGNPIPAPTVLYYAMIDGNRVGPMSESEVSQLISQKKISPDTYMWKPGMPDWKKVAEMPDVLRLVALMPPEFNK